MTTRRTPAHTAPYPAETHELSKLSSELCDYNLFSADAALTEAVQREGAAWAVPELHRFGRLAGSADYLELGQLANKLRRNWKPMTVSADASTW